MRKALTKLNRLGNPTGVAAPSKLYMLNTQLLQTLSTGQQLKQVISTKHHQQGLVVQSG